MTEFARSGSDAADAEADAVAATVEGDSTGSAAADRAGTSSGNDLAGAPPGSQTLVRTPGGADPFSALPESAFDNLLVVAARDHPRKLERRLDRAGHDPSRVGVVPVAPAAGAYDGDLWTTDPVAPDDLTGLGMRFSDALDHVEAGAGWVLVDALGVLLTYAADAQVCRLLQTVTNRARAKEVRGAYCVNPTVVADGTYEQLRGLCDVEYEVE